MTTEPRWEQARDLFLDLADLPQSQRDAQLAQLTLRDPELASQVRELLRHDRVAHASDGPAAPRRLGPWEIVRPLGAGGMGEVFVARRADGAYESEVAVKLLRAGTASQELVRRFLRERQALARLDHEYIARLLDGGTTESGEPYLVMEYVDGIAADAFAARLEIRERLELFIRIGRAVAHAHERGFVHRDLKPSNILVRADGTPRLLDFGIARLDTETDAGTPAPDPLTRTGNRLFTPGYASPEQVRGETATVRSDIFALGVLLHVFLTGTGPWDGAGSLHALERSICEEDAVAPSRRVTGTARRRLTGDLDAVVLQCLAKSPSERYASVADLCADLENHLAGRPIRARRTSALGRAVRFARRRPAYPVGVALLLIAGFASWRAAGSDRIERQRRAELRDAVANRIAAARLRWSDGATDDAFAELDAALDSLRGLPGEHALEATVLAERATFSNMQQDWVNSLALFDRAWPMLEAADAPDPRVRVKLLSVRAHALHRTDPGPSSQEAARLALEQARLLLPPGDPVRVDALLDWADELRRGGSAEDALAVLVEVVDETRRRDPKSEVLSRYLNELAVALAGLARFDESVARYREALEVLSWHRGERHPAFARVRLNLGTVLFRMGRLAEAKQEHERSLAVSREHGLDVLVASNQHFLGRIHLAQDRLIDAEAAAREAIAIRTQHDLGLHSDRSRCLLGMVHARAGRTDEARRTLEPLLADAEPGAFLPDMEAEARTVLGVILDDAGEKARARPHLTRALELKRALLGDSHEDCRELARRLETSR